jgi:hypothetical protein
LAVTAVARTPSATEALIDSLLRRLVDSDNDVRKAAVDGLVAIERQQRWSATIEQRLLDAIDSPGFAPTDLHECRSGHDYAYDALWQIVQGRTLEP